MTTFGLTIYESPLLFNSEKIRELLSIHGVLLFKGTSLSDEDLIEVMKKFGEVQTFTQQQAPLSDTDKDNKHIINLHNNDFLGASRMGWHMDQTFLKNPYLPIRSLYCSHVDAKNITEFADIKYLTDIVMREFPTLTPEVTAEYKIGPAKTIRSIYSYCEHVNRLLLRYDSRMYFQNGINLKEFKNYCEGILSGQEIPKISVQWEPHDFVIFDNNQAPHRREHMEGECKLKRVTSKFWLA